MLLMQSEGPFDPLLLFITRALLLFGFRLIRRQPIECFAGKMLLPLEVARNNELSLRVLAEPSFATLQQLLDLILANPIGSVVEVLAVAMSRMPPASICVMFAPS